MTAISPRARMRTAWLLFGALLVIYNSNGREIGAVDSQPTKFTARELAVRGTFRLDRVVDAQPGFARRPAFVRTYGHYLSAYPLLPAMLAAVPAALLHWTHVVDMDAPLAPNLIAVITASLLTAGAVALVYLALTRLVTPRLALAVAIALGIGTNYWPVVSRTLWQHETVAFGLALAVLCWLRPSTERPHPAPSAPAACRTRARKPGTPGAARPAAGRWRPRGRSRPAGRPSPVRRGEYSCPHYAGTRPRR